MYRARDQVENEEWLAAIDEAAERLDLGGDARSRAVDLFLSTVPKERRSQSEVADAVGVARLTVQKRWKDLVEEAGLEPPSW